MYRTALLALASMLMLAASAAGQAHHRRGIWFGAGAGYGSTSSEDSGNESGPGGYLRAGGTVSQDFLIGGEVRGWYWSSGNEEFLKNGASLVMIFYPMPRGNLLLKGAAGFAHAELKRVSPVAGGALEVERNDGFGMGLGVGYDFRVSRGWSISPNIEVIANNFDGFNVGLAILTVGVTWH